MAKVTCRSGKAYIGTSAPAPAATTELSSLFTSYSHLSIDLKIQLLLASARLSPERPYPFYRDSKCPMACNNILVLLLGCLMLAGTHAARPLPNRRQLKQGGPFPGSSVNSQAVAQGRGGPAFATSDAASQAGFGPSFADNMAAAISDMAAQAQGSASAFTQSGPAAARSSSSALQTGPFGVASAQDMARAFSGNGPAAAQSQASAVNQGGGPALARSEAAAAGAGPTSASSSSVAVSNGGPAIAVSSASAVSSGR